MSWVLLSVVSALFLGLYDVVKKSAVHANAVPPVLLLNVMTAALLWLPVMVVCQFSPESIPFARFVVEPLTWPEHGALFFKSVLVASSWICAFFALKHLPISIATPIRATAPAWTILIAVTAMGERPTPWQWFGISLVLAAFFAFSVVGRREGIHFHRDRWVAIMFVGTVLGALSALYDKHLIQSLDLRPATVQAWFSCYLVVALAPLAAYWFFVLKRAPRFEWRWTIPLIAVCLLVADFLYFTAIDSPGALISVISPVRRASVVVSFLAGMTLFGERNWRPKAACIAGILTGVFLLSLGR